MNVFTFKDLAFIGSHVSSAATIPIMTSNNTPSGVVDSDSEAGPANAGWKAFDGNDGTFWSSGITATGTGSAAGDGTSSFLRYTFQFPKTITSYAIVGGGFRFSYGYLLQGSKDNVNYVTLHSSSSISSASLVSIPHPDVYSSYRLLFLLGGNGLAVDTLQLYGY